MRYLPSLLLLSGCFGGSEAVGVDPAEALQVARTFVAAQPEAWLSLSEIPERWLLAGDTADGSACPSYESEGDRERWIGDCDTIDGLRVEGVLERYSDNLGSWIAGDGFVVWSGDEQVLFLDGAAETSTWGDILVLEASLSACGGPVADCESDDEMARTTVDLVYTLYPAADVPNRYELSVSGVVAAPDDLPATIDGTWTVEPSVCSTEPMSGSVVIDADRPHVLEFDGVAGCDACARWIADAGEDLACADWMQ